jgi:hypothetical protein
VGKVELTDAKIEPVRLWIVFDCHGNVLQLFKGVRADGEKGAERAYPERGPYRLAEAVDCSLPSVEFAVLLAQGDWACTQFAMLAQAMNPIQPAGRFRH